MAAGAYNVTNYCVSGTMSDGHQTHVGAVAVLDRSIPFGTKVLIDSRVYVVEDHVGWGTDFDIFNPDCVSADAFGREHVEVSEYHTPPPAPQTEPAQVDEIECFSSDLGRVCML